MAGCPGEGDVGVKVRVRRHLPNNSAYIQVTYSAELYCMGAGALVAAGTCMKYWSFSQIAHYHAVSSDVIPRVVLALARSKKCHATDLISRSFTDARLTAGKNAGSLSEGCSPQPDELVAESRLGSAGCDARATDRTSRILATDEEADPRLSSLAASWVWD